MTIHKSAIVHPDAQIGENVEIGPGAVVEQDVVIASGVRIEANAYIKNGSRIGEDCRIGCGAVLGGDPQDVKYKGEPTQIVLGKRNLVREYVTLNKSTGEGTATIIGDDNFLMANVHVGHNCKVGNNVVMANLVALGGHSEVGDRAFMGGLSGCHQFVRIGEFAMVGGGAILLEDVPPFMLTDGGYRARPVALNTVGLMRNGFSPQARSDLKKAFRILYKSGLTAEAALAELESRLPDSEEARRVASFIRQSKRGVVLR